MDIQGLARLPALFRLILALVAGAIGALAQAPMSLSVLILVPVFAGFLLLPGASSRFRGFGIGWAIAFGYFLIALRWLVEPFQVEADIYGWMAPIALTMMAAGLALFWGAAFALAWQRGAVALALCWTLGELGRAYLFTGFPWAGMPQAFLDTPFQHGLAVVGPHGVTLVLMLLVALSLRGAHQAGIAALVVVGLGVGFWAMSGQQNVPDRDQIVRVVQPNAPQHEKWDPDKWQTFYWRQVEATAAPAENPPDIIVWPETAIPQLAEQAGELRSRAAEAAQGSTIVMGAMRSGAGGFHNALLVLDGKGDFAQTYDKHHLVPFGEYMPFPALFRSLGIAALARRTEGGMMPGTGPAVVQTGALRALALVCYEAVFPQNARSVDPRPDYLLQITNDAWFGTYAGPQQHLAQARMRAIEQGLPLVRSANTGISAIIDSAGGIRAQLRLGQHGFVDAPLPGALPPTFYSRTGDLPVSILIFLGVGLTVLRGRRQIID